MLVASFAHPRVALSASPLSTPPSPFQLDSHPPHRGATPAGGAADLEPSPSGPPRAVPCEDVPTASGIFRTLLLLDPAFSGTVKRRGSASFAVELPSCNGLFGDLSANQRLRDRTLKALHGLLDTLREEKIFATYRIYLRDGSLALIRPDGLEGAQKRRSSLCSISSDDDEGAEGAEEELDLDELRLESGSVCIATLESRPALVLAA